LTLEFAEVGICGHVGGTDIHGIQFLFGTIVLAGGAGAFLQAVTGIFGFGGQVAHGPGRFSFAIAAAKRAVSITFDEVTFALPATALAAIAATDLTVTIGDAYALALLTLFVLFAIDGVTLLQADSTALSTVVTDLFALLEEVPTFDRAFQFVLFVTVVQTLCLASGGIAKLTLNASSAATTAVVAAAVFTVTLRLAAFIGCVANIVDCCAALVAASGNAATTDTGAGIRVTGLTTGARFRNVIEEPALDAAKFAGIDVDAVADFFAIALHVAFLAEALAEVTIDLYAFEAQFVAVESLFAGPAATATAIRAALFAVAVGLANALIAGLWPAFATLIEANAGGLLATTGTLGGPATVVATDKIARLTVTKNIASFAGFALLDFGLFLVSFRTVSGYDDLQVFLGIPGLGACIPGANICRSCFVFVWTADLLYAAARSHQHNASQQGRK
jgi:hypothetical protein